MKKVHIAEPRIKSGAANPAPTLATVVAGMCVGADCIDDVDEVRSGGMTTLFDRGVCTVHGGNIVAGVHLRSRPTTRIGTARTFGGVVARVDLLPGADQGVFIDIDSLLRPVYGQAKQGASYGHTKIAGKQILRRDCLRWPPRSAPRARLR